MTKNLPYAILRLALLLALLSAFPREASAKEPEYEGRRLTSWMNDFAYGRYPDMEKHHAAVKAVQTIGKDSLPILMQRIKTTSEDPQLVLLSQRKQDEQRLQDHYTASALEALGPVAHAEIPELIDLLAPQYDAASESPSDPEHWLKYRSSSLARRVLGTMGVAAAEPLLKALASKDPKIRFGAVGVLETTYRRTKDEQILLALVKTMRDEDTNVRWISARVLGAINTLPEICVPALAERVRDDPEVNVQCYAVNALRKFGPRARAALPELTAAAAGKNSALAFYAREAIQAIEAEPATEK